MSVSYLSLVLTIALSLQTIFSCLLVCFGLFSFCWKPGMLCRAMDTEVIRICNNLDRSWAVFEICYCYSFLWSLSLLWTPETSESSGDLVYVFPFGFGSVLCMIPRKDPISCNFPSCNPLLLLPPETCGKVWGKELLSNVLILSFWTGWWARVSGVWSSQACLLL